jgi:hypothetical protein
MRTRLSLLVLGVAAAAAAGCGDDVGPGLPGTCSLDFETKFTATFSEPKVNGLLEAVAVFNVEANTMDSDVRSACNAITTDLGGTPNADDTQMACAAASQAIQDALNANASASLVIVTQPGVCSVSASAVADCAARCDAEFDATATPPTCSSGMVSGTCSGMCSGECTVEGSVACEGSCNGTCTGACDAMCSADDGSGGCMGTCSGTCSGMCMGSCRATATATCTGTCSGSCDVDFEAPTCEGGEWDVEANAECSASCEAEASFEAECTPPSVGVTFTGMGDVDQLNALVATLEANLPTLLAAIEKAEVMGMVTVELGSQVSGAVSGLASAGLEAGDCLRQAVQVQLDAATRVEVSAQASVSVNATASGGI